MKHKRGQAHLEAIISTIIFIVFIFLLLIIIKPFGTTTPSNNAEILRQTIPNYLKADLNQVGLNVVETVRKECFYLPLNLTKHKVVWSSNGSLVKSRDYNDELYIGGIQGFYNVYYSSEFPDSTMAIANCDKVKDYRLGTTTTIMAVSYTKALELNKTYWEDYERAQEAVRAPPSGDFGFVIMNDQGRELINSFTQPTSRLNLDVKELAIPMLYNNGTIENVRLRIFSY